MHLIYFFGLKEINHNRTNGVEFPLRLFFIVDGYLYEKVEIFLALCVMAYYNKGVVCALAHTTKKILFVLAHSIKKEAT